MKTVAIYVFAGLLILTGSAVADRDRDIHYAHSHDEDVCEGMSFDLDDGSIIITLKDRRRVETVEITEDYELYINDERVELNDEQQKLVQEFHEKGMEIVAYAKRLGWEGASIGVSGAKLGLKAVGNIAKLIFTSYDTEDFEREIEREAAKIEARAAKLEKKAEKVEDMADDLEEIAWEMEREIPELRELNWF